ncbi:MAG: M56 family metallopeptidase [Bacteroidales bacterium]|nr:M56 family metallopeptidase [Bacteroidales bacterium]
MFIYANIYIIFFGVFYSLFLSKDRNFRANRILLIFSMSASLFLPFLQQAVIRYSVLPEVVGGNEINHLKIIYSIADGMNTLSPEAHESGWMIYAGIILCAGSVISLLSIISGHLRIRMLIRNAEVIEYGKNTIVNSNRISVPFSYNRYIVLPESIPEKDREIAISHELTHFRLGHYYDNYLTQIFQIIFWINPMFHLLKNSLKKVHEYQVDQLLINSGMDASEYKLTLIKLSVGYRKFAIANGLTGCKIKDRIIMMNSIGIKKMYWKLSVLIPALMVVFAVLSFTGSDHGSEFNPMQKVSRPKNPDDSVRIRLDSVTMQEIRRYNKTNLILVLMNRESALLINGKRSALEEVSLRLANSFQQMLAKGSGKKRLGGWELSH